ncbi:MAG: TonB-dependent receptor [Bryobacterales bacterium]|nr:TonB-dependent receptor [Bryobacterales bacterium]
MIIQNQRSRTIVIALLAVTIFALPSLPGKQNTGTVRGFVYDIATGTPLPQVQVKMIGEVMVTAITTIEGNFRIEGVPVGLYRISYSSAIHRAMNVEGLEVIAGEIADASAGMSMRVKSTGALSSASKQPTLLERNSNSTASRGIGLARDRDVALPDALRSIENSAMVTTLTNVESAGGLDAQNRRAALDLNRSETLAIGASVLDVDTGVDEQLPSPQATHDRVSPQAASAMAPRGSVRVDRNGLRIESRGGAFMSEMHLRSQIRFSSPSPSVPRQPGHFLRARENDLRFRRARFKTSGHMLRPWIRYATEYDLVGTRMLDMRVTVQKWEWLQFRFGQWKTEFGRERVSSSGRQEFVERSIVNRQFTVDRQKGFMVMGRVKNGTRADSRYYAGVFTGNGRGFRSSGAGSLDNRDGSPMWVTRYQWNFLKDDPGFSQSDLEYHRTPVAAIAIGTMSNRSRFTRFSGSGGGSLDGYEVGLPGQFAVRQVAEDFVLKYRGLFLQHELHWKQIRDRIDHSITRSNGVYFQGGYFPHYVAGWVPEQLELGLRYATVDQDRVRQFDRIVESAFVVNWFMEGHGNKLTFDIAHYRLAQPNGTDKSAIQARVQWDVSF